MGQRVYIKTKTKIDMERKIRIEDFLLERSQKRTTTTIIIKLWKDQVNIMGN